MSTEEPPTASTGLSGDTVKDTESTGHASRTSKRSFGKGHAGSRASSKRSQPPQMSEKREETQQDDAQSPNIPRKSKGFSCLRGLLCCGASKSLDDEDSSPPKPRLKIPPQQTIASQTAKDASTAESSTAESKPDEKVEAREPQLSEKVDHSYPNGQPSTERQPPGKPEPRIDTQVPSNHLEVGPQIAVQAPTPVTTESEALIHDRTPQQEQRDTEIEMTDGGATVPIASNEVAGTAEQEDTNHQGQDSSTYEGGKRDSKAKIDLPPPPPLEERKAQIAHHQDESPDQDPEPQRWLLPPPQPELKGRKCLVLDLDETLVHSSFKVCANWQTLHTENTKQSRFYIKQTSLFRSKLKVNIIMSMLSSGLASTPL